MSSRPDLQPVVSDEQRLCNHSSKRGHNKCFLEQKMARIVVRFQNSEYVLGDKIDKDDFFLFILFRNRFLHIFIRNYVEIDFFIFSSKTMWKSIFYIFVKKGYRVL